MLPKEPKPDASTAMVNTLWRFDIAHPQPRATNNAKDKSRRPPWHHRMAISTRLRHSASKRSQKFGACLLGLKKRMLPAPRTRGTLPNASPIGSLIRYPMPHHNFSPQNTPAKTASSRTQQLQSECQREPTLHSSFSVRIPSSVLLKSSRPPLPDVRHTARPHTQPTSHHHSPVEQSTLTFHFRLRTRLHLTIH